MEKREGILNATCREEICSIFFSLLFLAGVIRRNRSSLIMKRAFYGNSETIFQSSDEISMMCLDRRNRTIYFSNGSSIQSIDYFGADAKIILLSSFKLNLQFITQMNIFGSYIYMFESENNVFWRINKIFGQDPEPVFTARSPFLFAVFQGNFEKITCKLTTSWIWFNKPLAICDSYLVQWAHRTPSRWFLYLELRNFLISKYRNCAWLIFWDTRMWNWYKLSITFSGNLTPFKHLLWSFLPKIVKNF